MVNPYAHNDLVYIADTADEFINAAAYELSKSPAQTRAWLNSVDAFLENVSWDNTYMQMLGKIRDCMAGSTLQAGKLKSVA